MAARLVPPIVTLILVTGRCAEHACPSPPLCVTLCVTFLTHLGVPGCKHSKCYAVLKHSSAASLLIPPLLPTLWPVPASSVTGEKREKLLQICNDHNPTMKT